MFRECIDCREPGEIHRTAELFFFFESVFNRKHLRSNFTWLPMELARFQVCYPDPWQIAESQIPVILTQGSTVIRQLHEKLPTSHLGQRFSNCSHWTMVIRTN